MKKCNRCGETKSLELFNKDRYQSSGFTSRCKFCLAIIRKVTNGARTEYNRKWRAKNRNKYNKLLSQWRKNNPYCDASAKGRRRALIRNAIPPWLTKSQLLEITRFYSGCPKGYHVDHIIPLGGKIVTGLHVLWNLQYLPARENILKSNKIVPNAPQPAA